MIEVARRAGTSQATVSRVVNDHPNVSGATRDAVLRAMEELGYTPRPRGRLEPVFNGKGVATQKTGTLALVWVDRSHEKHPTLANAKWRGVMEAAAEAGLSLLALPAYEGMAFPPAFNPEAWDGVILWGRRASDELLAALQGVPQVWISSHGNPGEEQILSVNEVVGRMAARYLLERGHEQVGFLSLATSHPGLAIRGDGFRYAVKCESKDPVLLVDTEREPVFEEMNEAEMREAIQRLVKRLVKLPERPTGWFAPDDQMTAMLYPALAGQGLRAGEDVEIISCNNETPYLIGLQPRPATIDLAPYLSGRQAVHELLWNKAHPNETRQVAMMVAPALIAGDPNAWDTANPPPAKKG